MDTAVNVMEQTTNGINTDRIVELATSMSKDSDFGLFRFRAHNVWLDGSLSQTSIKDFYAGNQERKERPKPLTVNADQPDYLAGNNMAPNAVEHYLNALVSCITTTIIAHGSVQGIEFESLEVSAEGEMDARGFFGVREDVNRGYNKITVDINARTSADEATLKQLLSHSPVYEMVSRAIPVEVNMTVGH